MMLQVSSPSRDPATVTMRAIAKAAEGLHWRIFTVPLEVPVLQLYCHGKPEGWYEKVCELSRLVGFVVWLGEGVGTDETGKPYIVGTLNG